MRRTIFVFIVASTLGCALFRPETIRLSPQVVAEMELEYGDLSGIEYARLVQIVSKKIDSSVDSVAFRFDPLTGSKGLDVTLLPEAIEMVEAAGKTGLEKIAGNPTVVGIGASLLTALMAVLGVKVKRSKLRKDTTKGFVEKDTKL